MSRTTAKKPNLDSSPSLAQIELSIIERTALDASANDLRILGQQRASLIRNIQESEKRHAAIVSQIEKDHGLAKGAIGTTHGYYDGHLVEQ